MVTLRNIVNRIFGVDWRYPKEVQAEIDEELRFHIECIVEELTAEGWPADEAAEEARRRLGDIELLKLRCGFELNPITACAEIVLIGTAAAMFFAGLVLTFPFWFVLLVIDSLFEDRD